MSQPDEKRRSLLLTEDWLHELERTPGVPRRIRAMAVYLSRHYPSRLEITQFPMIGEPRFAGGGGGQHKEA